MKLYKLLLILFPIPLAIRILPELISGTYPLGFDTTVYYIPRMVEGTYLMKSILDLLKTTSLYYIIETIFYRISSNPILIIKFLGPMLYATMITLIGLYAYYRLRLSIKWLLILVSISSLSLIGLRLAWDLYRNMLGLIFLITTLILLNSHDKRIKYSGVLTSFLAVWSHELAAVYLIGILTLATLINFYRNRVLDEVYVSSIIVSSILFIYQRFNIETYSLNIPHSYIEFSSGLHNTYIGLLFLIYTSIILIIPSIFSLWNRVEDDILNIWAILTIVLLFTQLIGVKTILLSRIILMLILPLPIYCVKGLEYISGRLSKYKVLPPVLIILLLASISIPYLASTPNNPTPYTKFFYFSVCNEIFYHIPTGYLQNTIPIDNVDDLLEIINYAYNNIPSGSTLVVPMNFHWIQFIPNSPTTLNNNINVIYGSVIDMYHSIRSYNGTYYFIWWVEGSGWYNITELPENYIVIYENDVFALYKVIS